ncbi:hypothetical protein PVAP13_7NG098989 [Panicum virgatum]|uniref:F-box domain-containing protein n=1 Tax=Panicum virgatum TaxID=38727 RepID=A0A8T0Q426_PANVG|nr:hypothetical protein PVAP13_7NG098989 [Panicum virgatum]
MRDQTIGGRRRRTSPLDDDDLLGKILARVPPEPSSLPRVSIVCKRWQRLISGEWFRRRLHALAAAGQAIQLLGCRHGRVVFTDMSASTVFICDPITGGHARLAIPPELPKVFMNGTVLCTANEQGHVHGAYYSSHFKVVLVSISENDCRPTACVYSSETGQWEHIIRNDDREHPWRIVQVIGSSILIGHALYWLITFENHYIPERHGILEFDLDRQIIPIMKGPPINHIGSNVIIKTVDGGVGLVTSPYQKLELQVWHRNTADLHSIFGLQWHERWPEPRRRHGIFGYDEDDNFRSLSLFMLQLDTMQFKMHYKRLGRRYLSICHPFRSFYTAGDSSSVVLTL